MKSRKPILSEKSMKDIVLNVAEIYAMSYDLLRELEKRMEEWYLCVLPRFLYIAHIKPSKCTMISLTMN